MGNLKNSLLLHGVFWLFSVGMLRMVKTFKY